MHLEGEQILEMLVRVQLLLMKTAVDETADHSWPLHAVC